MLTNDVVEHFRFAERIAYPAILFLAILINTSQSLSINLLINPLRFFYQACTLRFWTIFFVGILLLNIRYKKEINCIENKASFYIYISALLFIQSYYAAKFNLYIMHNIIISLIITRRILTKINESDITEYTKTKGLFVYIQKNKGELFYKTYRNVLFVVKHFVLYYISYRMTYYISFGLIGYSHVKNLKSVMEHIIFYSELFVTILVYFLYYELVNMIFCYNISLKYNHGIKKMPGDIAVARFYMFQKLKAGYESKKFDGLLREYMIVELHNLKRLIMDIGLELEKGVLYNGVKIPSVGSGYDLWRRINFTEKLKRRKKISDKLKRDMIEYFKIVKILADIVNLVSYINDRTISKSLYQNECVILIQYIKERSIKLEEMYLIDLKSDFLQSINYN